MQKQFSSVRIKLYINDLCALRMQFLSNDVDPEENFLWLAREHLHCKKNHFGEQEHWKAEKDT